MPRWKLALVGCVFGFAVIADAVEPVPAGRRMSPAPISVLQLSANQPAPRWLYKPGERYREIYATDSLFTETLAAYLGESALEPACASKIAMIVSGGREPECQGGLGGWTHGPLAWSLAFARHHPGLWSRLTSGEQKKCDLLMQALAVAANYCLDDDNAYRCLIDGDKNWSKHMNPNHVEGYVGVAMAAAWYFGVDSLDQFFIEFDFDTFLAHLRAAGFTNIIAAWTHSPETRRVLMQGGPFQPADATYGQGLGVRGNRFTYLGHRLDQRTAIFAELTRKMFPHRVKTEVPVTGRDWCTHMLAEADGRFLISPYEGLEGMCAEFITTNAPKQGSNFRSSLLYVYEGWKLHVANALALAALGDSPAADESLRARTLVGSRDFLFKATHGYHGFANGEVVSVTGDRFKAIPGQALVIAWWQLWLEPQLQ